MLQLEQTVWNLAALVLCADHEGFEMDQIKKYLLFHQSFYGLVISA